MPTKKVPKPRASKMNPPQNLSVVSKTDTEIRAKCDPCPMARAYEFQYSRVSSFISATSLLETNPEATIAGLLPGTTYYIRVQAIYTGINIPSNPIQVQTLPATAPALPSIPSTPPPTIPTSTPSTMGWLGKIVMAFSILLLVLLAVAVSIIALIKMIDSLPKEETPSSYAWATESASPINTAKPVKQTEEAVPVFPPSSGAQQVFYQSHCSNYFTTGGTNSTAVAEQPGPTVNDCAVGDVDKIVTLHAGELLTVKLGTRPDRYINVRPLQGEPLLVTDQDGNLIGMSPDSGGQRIYSLTEMRVSFTDPRESGKIRVRIMDHPIAE